MKRHPALVGLSQDHHDGLVLARRCLSRETTWPEVVRIFEEELEPHFRTEERLLLPALGSDPLVERTHADHAELRRQVEQQAALPAFGEALRAHIRFEERELFERAQQIMDAAQLSALLAAWPRQQDRGRR